MSKSAFPDKKDRNDKPLKKPPNHSGCFNTIVFICFLAFFATISSSAPLSAQNPSNEPLDPFYAKLCEEGKFFWQDKNLPEAVANFEIAFFGCLDNLPKLLECYIYLTVCHFEQKNEEKTRYYAGEIKRLKLQHHMESIDPPEELMEKYDDIITRLERLKSRAKK